MSTTSLFPKLGAKVGQDGFKSSILKLYDAVSKNNRLSLEATSDKVIHRNATAVDFYAFNDVQFIDNTDLGRKYKVIASFQDLYAKFSDLGSTTTQRFADAVTARATVASDAAAALEEETRLRGLAELELKNKTDTERQDRIDADAIELSARASGDGTNLQKINDEKSAREGAIYNLNTDLRALITTSSNTVASYNTTNDNNISTINGELNDLETNYVEADNTESKARSDADGLLGIRITDEISAAVSTLNGLISAERSKIDALAGTDLQLDSLVELVANYRALDSTQLNLITDLTTDLSKLYGEVDDLRSLLQTAIINTNATS